MKKIAYEEFKALAKILEEIDIFLEQEELELMQEDDDIIQFMEECEDAPVRVQMPCMRAPLS